MKTSTIADAKNNLSQLLAQLEVNEPIQLTRYGKPVAVILSQAGYQQLIQPEKNCIRPLQIGASNSMGSWTSVLAMPNWAIYAARTAAEIFHGTNNLSVG